MGCSSGVQPLASRAKQVLLLLEKLDSKDLKTNKPNKQTKTNKNKQTKQNKTQQNKQRCKPLAEHTLGPYKPQWFEVDNKQS